MANLRDKVLTKINSFINDNKLSSQVEDTIFQFTNSFCKDNNIICNHGNPTYSFYYLENVRFILENLDSGNMYIKNENFLQLLIEGKLEPKDIFDYKKIFQDHWTVWEKDLDILNKEIADINPETATTTQFHCSKCRKNTKCSYFQMQTRSADEPMTSFIVCLACNHNWRE